MLYLTDRDVAATLTWDACIPLVRQAMIGLSHNATDQPLRNVMALGTDRFFGVMAGTLGEKDVFGAKLVSVFTDPGNMRQSHRGVVVLFDGPSGRTVCVTDAEQITTIRTAAASAVATQVLARENSRVLGLFGCGTQAAAHLSALRVVRPFARALVWGRNPARAAEFAREQSALLDLDCEGISDPESVARQSDVICTLTASSEPVLFGGWVRPGTHVNAVGASVAWGAEVDGELVAKSRYIVDSRASARAQAGEYRRALDAGLIDETHIAAEIGEVLGGAKPGRMSPAEITLYKSLGHVVQDLVSARYLYERHCADGSLGMDWGRAAA